MSEGAVPSPVGWLKQILPARMPSLLIPRRLLNAPSQQIEWCRFKSTNRLPSPHSEIFWSTGEMVSNKLNYEDDKGSVKIEKK